MKMISIEFSPSPQHLLKTIVRNVNFFTYIFYYTFKNMYKVCYRKYAYVIIIVKKYIYLQYQTGRH